MTPAEIKAEWDVEYETQLGNKCGSGKPTPKMIAEAMEDANRHIAKLRRKDKQNESAHRLPSLFNPP